MAKKKITIEELFDKRMEEVRGRVRPTPTPSPFDPIRQTLLKMRKPKL